MIKEAVDDDLKIEKEMETFFKSFLWLLKRHLSSRQYIG